MATEIPTPFPIGSPHALTPPRIDRWRVSSSRSRTDKRDYDRRKIQCDLWMSDIASRSVLRCKTDNISDAGIHASAPIGFGLSVGQRYEVRIADTSALVEGAKSLSSSLGYGTVIRTEIRLGGDRPDRVGFAMRFDAPQLIPA
jgi:hypothetical protein